VEPKTGHSTADVASPGLGREGKSPPSTCNTFPNALHNNTGLLGADTYIKTLLHQQGGGIRTIKQAGI